MGCFSSHLRPHWTPAVARRQAWSFRQSTGYCTEAQLALFEHSVGNRAEGSGHPQLPRARRHDLHEAKMADPPNSARQAAAKVVRLMFRIDRAQGAVACPDEITVMGTLEREEHF